MVKKAFGTVQPYLAITLYVLVPLLEHASQLGRTLLPRHLPEGHTYLTYLYLPRMDVPLNQ